LPHRHFDFSERETRIELDTLITQLSLLHDDEGQLFTCRNPGGGVSLDPHYK
jgi:hypothetical protein